MEIGRYSDECCRESKIILEKQLRVLQDVQKELRELDEIRDRLNDLVDAGRESLAVQKQQLAVLQMIQVLLTPAPQVPTKLQLVFGKPYPSQ